MNAVAAGATSQNSSSVDMQDWDEVEFVALLGTLTATQVTRLKIQQSSDNGAGDAFADLEASATAAMADGDSNKILRSGIARPRERYVRGVLVRGTANAVIDGMIAIQRRARKLPFGAQSSTVSAIKGVYSPAEGAA